MSKMYEVYGSINAIVESSDTHVHIKELTSDILIVFCYNTFTIQQLVDISNLIVLLLDTTFEHLNVKIVNDNAHFSVKHDE